MAMASVPSSSPGSADKPRRGRPRSEKSHRAILTATWDLLVDEGFESITSDRIAARAGVSKATIYKWWPSKAALAADAFLSVVQEHVEDSDVGDVTVELSTPAKAQMRLWRDTPVGHVLSQFIAAAQSDPDVAEALRTRWLAPRRAQAIEAVHRAQARGDLRADVPGDIVLDMVFGPIYYRLLAGHAPLDEEMVDTVVATVVRGLTPPSKGTATARRRKATG